MSTKVGGLRWLVVDLALLVVLPALAAAYDSGVITPPWVEPSISGIVFNDLDGDGKHDWYEPGLKGWNIVEGHSDMLHEIGETGGGGFYRISGVSAGSHAVRAERRDLLGKESEEHWYFTFPADFWHEVDLKEGESKKDVNFGLRNVGDSTVFFGRAWIDGQTAPDGSQLLALADGKVCGRSRTQDEYFAVSARHDCGEEGHALDLELAGQEVDWVWAWGSWGTTDFWPTQRSGTARQVYMGAGEPFAVFHGAVGAYDVYGAPRSLDGVRIRALIAGLVCGEDTISVGQLAGYEMIVPGASLKPGCGVEGATVTFQVGDRLANESVGWNPGFQSQLVTVGEPPPLTPWPTPSPEPTPGLWTRTPTPSATRTPSPSPSTPTAGGEPAATPTPRP